MARGCPQDFNEYVADLPLTPSQAMRILVLDTNAPYANATARVLLRALARKADVVFGGIGFDVDTSRMDALERRFGRFDVVLGQTWMFGQPGAGQYGAFVPRDLRDHPAPKVLNLLQVDPYAVPEYIYDSCVRPSDAVLTTVVSPQFDGRGSRHTASRESWFDPNLFLVRHSELIDEKWLMLPHCINEREFVPVGAVRKKWDVIVPGVGYHFRSRARARLSRRQDISLASLEGPIQRVLYWMSSYYVAQRVLDVTPYFQGRFRKRIAASRVGVTCDGSIGYAVRKFFEIPAFGTLLAARFFPGADALGFRDGENCFALDDEDLERLDEVVAFARGDGVAARRMIEAGQAMVRQLHTADRRAEQLISLLAAVCEGRLGRVRWREGRMAIEAPGEGGR